MISSVTFELFGDILAPGFKPLIWQYAVSENLGGWITDSKSSVILRLTGEDSVIQRMIRTMPRKVYPRFVLKNIRVKESETLKAGYDENAALKAFRILSSPYTVSMRPDFKPCEKCISEMRDPTSRRYAYPFSFCKDCGPGISIALFSPLTRKNSMMASFPPCSKCISERDDRRDLHHSASEFICCPDCGPHLYLLKPDGTAIDSANPLMTVRKALRDGKTAAVQSFPGGFSLIVNAHNREAFKTLYQKKISHPSPLTLIARNIRAARSVCELTPEEESALKEPGAPLVLVQASANARQIIPEEYIDDNGGTIALTLPSSGVLELLCDLADPKQEAIPPFDLLAFIHTNTIDQVHHAGTEEILFALHDAADIFLCHDMGSAMDAPPSRYAIREGQKQIIRCGRGAVPQPIHLKEPLHRMTAAFGSDESGAIALGFDHNIFLSQYLGKITGDKDKELLDKMVKHYSRLYDAAPDAIVCDMDPEQLSSIAAAQFAEQSKLPLITVQTHHAHALSCMAENGLTHALALVFDFGAKGPDGLIWGAEALDVGIESFRRLATFKSVSTHQFEQRKGRPVRTLVSAMIACGLNPDEKWIETCKLQPEEFQLWENLYHSGRTRPTHACGNLFDAAGAILGTAPVYNRYRAHTMVRLSCLASQVHNPEKIPESMKAVFSYAVQEEDGLMQIDWTPFIRNCTTPFEWLVRDQLPMFAAAFHESLSDAAVRMIRHASETTDVKDVVLSGGIFADGVLSDRTAQKLRANGYQVYLHHTVPLDESGIAAGQAYHGGISS